MGETEDEDESSTTSSVIAFDFEEEILIEKEMKEHSNEQLAQLATEEEPAQDDGLPQEMSHCDETPSRDNTSLKESWTRVTLYALDEIFTKYSQFTAEEANTPLVKSNTHSGPITSLFNQRWGVADFADLDLAKMNFSPLEKTLSLPGYGRLTTNNNNDHEIELAESVSKSLVPTLKRSKSKRLKKMCFPWKEVLRKRSNSQHHGCI